MRQLPVFLNLKGRRCLLVGGGGVALRKAKLLQRAGAILTAVAPDIHKELADLVSQGGGDVAAREFHPDDLDGVAIVVSATNQAELNACISALAQKRNIPVNVVDQPELCSFIFPAIVDRSPILIAVSSGGDSPVLARLIRGRLESTIPAAYGRLAELAGKFRGRVKERFAHLSQRRHFWEKVLQGPIAELVFSGKLQQAEDDLEQALQSASPEKLGSGEVYLVGAGPGDPDLLTFRALRLMQQADVVLYDRLVSAPILELCRRDAEMVHVGKASRAHTMPQQDINQLLVSLARQGKRVLRLKGGDPFIFGRGGEEIDQLMAHSIPFQVVPGITAASGCAAYAGIPLTHRDYAQSVRFLTGHLKDDSCDLPWQELVSERQTLVFYMSLISLEVICEQLIAAGKDPQTPVAVVERGTLPQQRVHLGTLVSMPGVIKKAEAVPPTLMIVGQVVKLRSRLAWFDGDRI